MKELDKRITAVENTVEKIAEETEKFAEETVGMIDVYKEIIRNSEEARTASKETSKFLARITGTLSILIIILVIILTFTHIEFSRYRDNSITKTELIEYLKD